MAIIQLDGPRRGPRGGGVPDSLVLLLHGVGADGRDLIDLASRWADALPGALFVAPDAPFPHDQAPPGWPGRQWFSLAEWFARPDRDPAVLVPGLRRAADLLDGFLDAEMARLALAPGRCALMGFSQGAMTALFAGLRRPVPPAGVLAYSGALAGVAATPRAAPPVLLVHGEADDVVPVAASRAAEAALRRIGLPVEAHYTPGLGHGIDEAGLLAGARFLRRVLG
ncbi:prolyl oligopeptidase family serine peptidase [Roseomonas sp. NAR14]|uniref:Prolyl oligopeptidase family serine peptidase n=1 Tax=Roseomonas acroporae TaxID=2937791 RepID=A0A9X1Y4L5_9PROT|nr:prolyl oligopeptidase family serine peptidase [Roseomonas acroporae]MCK8783052.1 prolyl oligopeptidase family serine peptidase [Roseomonas acroporae]